MKRLIGLILLALIVSTHSAVAMLTSADRRTDCGEGQHFCEHLIATFCAGEACGYSYQEGACVDKKTPCDVFWCGPQKCQKRWFTSNAVCCVYQDGLGQSSYACSASELNCRGNTQRLTIRNAPDTSS